MGNPKKTSAVSGVFGVEDRINDLVRSITKEIRDYLALENKNKDDEYWRNASVSIELIKNETLITYTASAVHKKSGEIVKTKARKSFGTVMLTLNTKINTAIESSTI